MFAYVVRRCFTGVIMLIVMSFVTYFLFFASPIDPGRFACGKSCPPALIKQTDKALGFDKPWPVQWKDFAIGVVKGRDYPEDPALRKSAPELISHCPAPCLGYSQVNLINVTTELKDKIPISVSLALVAFVMWIIGGISLGAVAALTKGSIIDRGVVGTSLVFYAFPTFWMGLFLIEFPAIKWGLVQVPSYTSIADGGVWGWLSNLFLPGLTLALFYMAGYVRITRAFVLESMSEDYLRTAKAKGLAPRKILFKHTMRAALTPIVTLAGLDLAGLLGGAIITEQVFNFNGLGKLAVDSTQTFDLPTVVGLVLLLAAFVIVANIIVDILYAVIDPRVRVG
ncbi:MAG: binding-protein-dependent transport system inner rane component [Marmoricola sp.]|nr:binding-protein-dependent transport system inner rane component [Marmoricola sp.]